VKEEFKKSGQSSSSFLLAIHVPSKLLVAASAVSCCPLTPPIQPAYF